MRFHAVTFLILSSLVFSIPCIHAAEMKIASVDVRKVFNGWSFAAKSDAELKKQREALEKENNDRMAVINEYQMQRSKMHQDFQTNRGSVTAEQKAELNRKFMELGRDAFALEQNRRDFYLKAQRNLNREVSVQSKLILDKIAEAVQAYALSKEYDMVIEMGGHTTRNLPLFLHLDSAEDITEEIIKRLNASE